MKIQIVSFGHKKDELYGDAVEEYRRRIVKPWSLTLVDLPSERRSPSEAADVVMAREAAALAAYNGAWLLDVQGKALSTEELAERLRKAQDGGTRELPLVIGGADGLHPSLRKNAAQLVSLSRLTLPHRLARVLLVEQLYRAQTILRGEPYHK